MHVSEFIPHHQRVPTGLQCAQADTEEHSCGEGVVVYEASAMGISMTAVQCQVGISVSRVQHRTEVNL